MSPEELAEHRRKVDAFWANAAASTESGPDQQLVLMKDGAIWHVDRRAGDYEVDDKWRDELVEFCRAVVAAEGAKGDE